MSQHIYEHQGTEVRLGYDRPLDYVYCYVERDGEPLYSNLSDPQAGTQQQDVDYFRPVLKELGISLPEAMFDEVKHDQANHVGNRVVRYTSLGKA